MSDPIIDQIREARRRISEECGHDPARLIERYMKLEKEQYADRLVQPQRKQPVRDSEKAG